MTKFTNLGLLAIIASTCWMCNFNPDQLVPPQWDTNFIGPLVRAKATLDDILLIGDQRFEDEIVFCEMLDQVDPLICSSPIAVPIPAVPPTDFPGDTLEYSDIYNSLTLDSGLLRLTVNNDLPINVKSGLEIEILNADGSPFLTFTLSNDLAANGGSALFEQDLAGRTFSSAFIVNFNEVASDGSPATPVGIDPADKIGFVFEIITLKVREVNLVEGNSFSLGDTSEFTLEDGIVINSQPLRGTLNFLVQNEFDAAFILQAYFLTEVDDDVFVVVDSLFPEGIITPNSDSVVLSTDVDEARIENLKLATHVVSKADWIAVADPPGFDEALLRNTDTLGVTLVAEIEVRVKP